MTHTTGLARSAGTSFTGQYFTGRIDEVRIYNRALSQAEIQTDMNTAVGGILRPTRRRRFRPIMHQTINEDTATGAIAFTVGDAETAAGSLTVSGSFVNHDAGAEWEYRVWGERGEPHGDGDAGGQSERDGDDHGDCERRAVAARPTTFSC